MWRWLTSLRGEGPPRSAEELRRRRRDGVVILLIAILFGVFAAMETGLGTLQGDESSLSGNITFFLLINFNLILLILLIFLVIRNLVKLLFERRRRILGSRLRTRLVLAFVGLTLFPAILLFIVAQGFLGRVFDTWFSVRVANSLNDAMEIAETTYQQAGNSALHFAKVLAREVEQGNLLRPQRRQALADLLDGRASEFDLAFVEIYDLSGEVLARAGDAVLTGGDGPATQELAGVFRGEEGVATVAFREGDLVRGAVPLEDGSGRITGALSAGSLVGRSLRQPARDIAKSYQEFRHFEVLRQPIKNSYILSLLLITLVIIFSATWFGFQLANTITVPIQRLAEGTREVAQGNWEYRIEAGGDHEMNTLVDSFNRMTREVQKINAKVDEGRRYTETILANVAAGVVAIGPSGQITTINRAAESLLGLRADVRGASWEIVFQRSDLREVLQMISRVARGEEGEVEGQIKLAAGPRVVTALVTVTVLRDEGGAAIGTMVFFEDVSHLRRVERMEAWREVARRIAHEIKNPLTPIQLSAQRLRRKYLGQLDPQDDEVFGECTRTIVRQVDELKRLVNEFASFARLPPADMQAHDLNEVVDEALVLFREGHRDVAFVFTPQRDLPPIEIDREAVTRALINLLDNAVAACRSNPSADDPPHIELATCYKERLGVVQVEVADNGGGIPPEMRGRLFEPYASTKKDGTGLGLAIVSAIAADHQAYVRVRDNEPRGTRFVIEFPLRRRDDAPRVARA